METPGVDILYKWDGQIARRDTFQDKKRARLHSKEDVVGDDYLYRVRIFSRHDINVKDEDLPLARVLLPPTSSGGGGGANQTPLLLQGTYVSGHYADGSDANQPVITNVWPNNAQTARYFGNFRTPFEPVTGFDTRQRIPQTQIDKTGKNPTEGTNPNIAKKSHLNQYIDASRIFYVPKPKDCQGPSGQLKGIQRSISDALKYVNLVRSGILQSSDLQGLLDTIINTARTTITALVKNLIDSIRSYILNKINEEVTKQLLKLPPNLRADFNKEVLTLTDVLLCIFQKIIRQLYNLVVDLLNNLIEKYINAPMCAAEAFIANILNNVFDEINDGISAVLSPLGISSISADIFSGLSLVSGILEFLTCEDDLNCEMPEQWSIWSGVNTSIEAASNNLNQRIAGITSSLRNATGEVISCNTSSIPCGPPKIRFFGNSTTSASGNAIVSVTGSILGIDLKTGGSGYTNPPRIEIVDECGYGSGALAIPVMEDDDKDKKKKKVKKIVLLDSGTGYLPSQNGALGGNGYVTQEPPEVERGNEPTVNESYPVVLQLEDIAITDYGSNYTPGDKVVISPDNGSQVSVEFNENGQVQNVSVINPGIGFTELPEIYIDSQTGFNATLLPVFNIVQVGDNLSADVPIGTDVLNVVDCVGKVTK